jgi:TonB family protein
MNRLQKKCIIGTAGFHLLLLLILLVGPAFFAAREKPDDTPVLDMIPANLVDSATTGAASAQPAPTPPPPAPPVVQQQPTPTPTPPPIKPVVVPPTPTPTPPERILEPVEKPQKEIVKRILEPTEKPAVTKPAPPKMTLTPTTRVAPNPNTKPTVTAPDNSRTVNSALTALRKNLSSATEVSMPSGTSGAAAANYAQVVKSVYTQAWTPPDDTASDDANIKVRVTIASDGTVISARVITPSGDASVDKSVRNTLERVQNLPPFPSGSSDKERTYIINFNLKAKRMLG